LKLEEEGDAEGHLSEGHLSKEETMRTMGIGVIIVTVMLLQGTTASPQYTSAQHEKAALDEMNRAKTARKAADRNLEILMQKVKADKKLLVASNMDLTDAEAKQFWPIYDSYQKDLERINQRLGGTISEYANAYKNGPVPDDQADKLLNQALDAEEAEVRLKQSYAEKLEAAIPTRKVTRYLQIENKIRAGVKNALAERIPLIQ
jgi:hypothetical protein